MEYRVNSRAYTVASRENARYQGGASLRDLYQPTTSVKPLKMKCPGGCRTCTFRCRERAE